MEEIEIKFKSYPEYWNKESLGLKRNTVRKEDNDVRFKALKQWMAGKIDLRIGIINTETGDVFYRIVTDVSKFDNYYIISW